MSDFDKDYVSVVPREEAIEILKSHGYTYTERNEKTDAILTKRLQFVSNEKLNDGFVGTDGLTLKERYVIAEELVIRQDAPRGEGSFDAILTMIKGLKN